MASRKRRRVAALALVSAAWWLMALFAGGDDARAAGWLPAVNVTPASATYSSPRLAMDDRGDLFATWVDTDGASAGHVQVSKRPVGGSWEDPETLDAKVDADFAAPDIAVDAAGNAVVVYSQDGATIRQARRLAGDSAFGDESPVPLGVAGPTNDFPRVAVNRRGDAVLAWRGFQMANPGVKVTVGSVTAPFGAPQQAYAPNTQPVSPPDVDINEAGDAAATWQTTPGSSVAIVAAYRPHGGTFQTTPDTLEGTSSVGLSDPEVAVDSQGRAVALFVRSAGDRIGARSRAAGVGTPWAVLPNPEVDVLGTGFLEVAFDAQDSAVGAWSGLSQVRVATRPAGGVFDSPPPDTLTDDQEVASSLAVDSSVLGTIALAWQRNASNTIRAAIRPPGGPFGAVATLTGPGRFGNAPDTAADQTGNAAAVWTDTDSAQGDPRIASAVYDATPPQIANVQVPPVANAGTPVAMAVDANDDWSTPAVVWDFGDETAPPGSGIQVNHTYASPGTYKVTITAVDSVGNVATTSRDIVVGTGEVVDPPTRGVDFNASQVSGTVLVSVPKNAPAERVLARPPVAHGAAAIRP
ncbi:MAG: hypothetical protein QOE77_4091, partial [Blastocatellia bacterium]|nr:hypothetical protein [Blastocatellia bacterium]